MALTNAHVLATNRIPDLFRKIQDGQAPDRFTIQLLKDWGFKSTNDRAFIPLLKALGFLTADGVPNISEADRLEIAEKKIDKLNSIIDVMKKYKVLDALSSDVYDDLHKLRKYRNKIHIQDDIAIEAVSRDEATAFSKAICDWAIGLNKRVLKHLSENLPRPKELSQFVESLSVPGF